MDVRVKDFLRLLRVKVALLPPFRVRVSLDSIASQGNLLVVGV